MWRLCYVTSVEPNFNVKGHERQFFSVPTHSIVLYCFLHICIISWEMLPNSSKYINVKEDEWSERVGGKYRILLLLQNFYQCRPEPHFPHHFPPHPLPPPGGRGGEKNESLSPGYLLLLILPLNLFTFTLLPPSANSRRLQRDASYLGWPIAPSHMSPNAGGGGELLGLS